MKRVLFIAHVESHILHFHLPFLKIFQDNGYETHVATNGKEIIPYCNIQHNICFERSPLNINNIKADILYFIFIIVFYLMCNLD